MESRAAWYSMAAIREFAVRAAAQGTPGEFAADELAGELTLTWRSAAGRMGYARDVAERLPRTFAALAAGRPDALQVVGILRLRSAGWPGREVGDRQGQR